MNTHELAKFWDNNCASEQNYVAPPTNVSRGWLSTSQQMLAAVCTFTVEAMSNDISVVASEWHGIEVAQRSLRH